MLTPTECAKLNTMDANIIETQALQLPISGRAKLAEKLLTSLQTPENTDINEAWLDKATERATQIDAGEVSLITATQAAKDIQKLLA